MRKFWLEFIALALTTGSGYEAPMQRLPPLQCACRTMSWRYPTRPGRRRWELLITNPSFINSQEPPAMNISSNSSQSCTNSNIVQWVTFSSILFIKTRSYDCHTCNYRMLSILSLFSQNMYIYIYIFLFVYLKIFVVFFHYHLDPSDLLPSSLHPYNHHAIVHIFV